MHGLPPQKDSAGNDIQDGATSPHHRAVREVGRVMERLLAAVDANDEDKLFAAISFYNSVLSTSTALVGVESSECMHAGACMREGALNVGIDLVAFVRELLQRLFAAVDTMHSGKEGTGAVDEDTCDSATAPLL
jgi:hypothetical protein